MSAKTLNPEAGTAKPTASFNVLFAASMTKRTLAAGLYAPVRVVITTTTRIAREMPPCWV